jgi:diadenosine tetraphosphate (Ap4A) HIT family hydrolase
MVLGERAVVAGPRQNGARDTRGVSDCFVCREVAGEVDLPGGLILDEDQLVAFHVWPAVVGDESPPLLGHLLVVPRRHAAGWDDLTPEEAAAIGVALGRLAGALRRTLELERVYTATLGHHVPHLHVHVFPRHAGTPVDVPWHRVDEWEDAPKGDARKIAALAERLRDH